MVVLFRIEIVIFLSALLYSIYYIGHIFWGYFLKKSIKKKERIEKRKSIMKKNKTLEKESKKKAKKTINIRKLSSSDIVSLKDIIKRVQVNKLRGYYDTARNLIVEGLAIDKYHKWLNIELADIYELEENYKNAEYIYKDLLKVYVDNLELLKKLWNVRILQWKLQSSCKSYEKVFDKKRDDIEVVGILWDIYFQLKNFKKCLLYSKLFLKDKPRDIEKLWMKWYCLEREWKIGLAIECYQKILETQPYNMEIKERVKKLRNK